MDQRCKNCRYADWDKEDGYICTNDESEYIMDFVEYDHTCEDWEEKEE